MNSIKWPSFVSFISSPAGRSLRVIAGLSIIAAGLAQRNPKGYAVVAAGIVPLAAGALDICVLGPLLGGSFKGQTMRADLHRQQGHPELGDKSSSWMLA